jgi:cytochrome b pre-mRNA-processing protein 3
MREIGYDDSGLKRRLKKVVGAFYGRTEATTAALADDQPSALPDVLARNVYGGAAIDPRQLARFADYVRDFARRLADVPVDELVSRGLPSMTPPAISAGEPAFSDIKS